MAFMDAKAILTKSFHDIDTGRTGYIDAFEVEDVFKKYYASMGRQLDYETLKSKVIAFMKRVDIDDDKKITLDEFLDYFLKRD